MSRPAAAIFFIGPARQGTPHGGIAAATAQGIPPLERETGKPFRPGRTRGDVGFENLPDVLRPGSPQSRCLLIHLRQQRARQPHCQHVWHTYRPQNEGVYRRED